MADLKTDEPVLVGAGALAGVNAVLGVLVTHHIITDTEASSWTQTLVPIVAAGLTMLAGVLIRRFTTPARKVAAAMARDGLVTDADMARMMQGLADVIDSRFIRDETSQPVRAVAATEADATPTVAAPDGMAAGATPAAPVASAQ